MNKAIAGLTALAAAAGLSCARDAPVYNQTRALFPERGEIPYVLVQSNAEQMSISLYDMINGEEMPVIQYTRTEPAGSSECISEQLIFQNEDGTLRRLDNECDLTVDEWQDSEYSNAFARSGLPNIDATDFVYAEDMDFAKRLFGIDNEVSVWHARKGL